jgi:hypothetical protein
VVVLPLLLLAGATSEGFGTDIGEEVEAVCGRRHGCFLLCSFCCIDSFLFLEGL